LLQPTPWKVCSRQVLYLVARSWQERKGYPHFAELAKTLRAEDPSIRFKVLNHKGDELMDGAPYLTRSELAEEFRRSYLAVVPGLWDEPFGLVAAEAMAAGRPVVAYATGGLPEIIEDGVSGILVPRGDVRALTESVRSLLKDPERARRLGEGARARVEAKFRYERTASEYLALIQRLLDRGARPAASIAGAG
jgi:glycosyltransferase involved in cell wall biosynthesis